ncbi:MAG: HlyC/CorC family transporter [Candidatus Omnitrophica bacterium]|nr:HlyC/CorC family transporter [Candidatus Omnitrophota bacterium]
MTYLFSQLISLFILLAFSAFFSGSEAAVFSLSKLEKKRLSTQHPRAWKTISTLLERPRRTLITILIGNMVVNTMATFLATLIALHLLGPRGVVWIIPLFTFILVIIGELTPKVFAVRHNEWFAFFFAFPLDFFARLLFPIRRLVRLIADRVLSILVHEKKSDADLISETELMALARIGEEEGAIKPEEGEMIENLIHLGDRMVREIMTPRTDLVAFDIEAGREKLIALIEQFHFSYVPVYEKTLDQLLGVISTQEFMLDDQKRLRELIAPPYYIPETKPIDELLQEFQKTGTRVAVCVDEYGGTAGLVTLEDILEEIFGEFYDEYAKADPLIKTTGDGVFLVHGKVGLHELNESLGISLTSETSETLNGWLLEQFGKIPKPNESFRWEGIEFQIKEMLRQRILKVEIRKKK